ncbi:MAG: hypothetical protein ABR606_10795 [Vicinamibacterales bacterium]
MSTSTHPESPLDREHIAHIEVGNTNVSPGIARSLVLWFLLMLAALPSVEWVGADDAESRGAPSAWAHLSGLPEVMADRLAALHAGVPEASHWTRIVTANRAVLEALSAFETALEDDSPVGRLLRPPTQVVLSGWLGVGNERVYAGRDGWLFYRPDVEYITGRGFLEPQQLERRARSASEFETVPQPDPRPAIRQFKRDLDARGIKLVVMPTPVKSTVHPDRIAPAYHFERAPLQNASYAAFLDDIAREGVLLFDPASEVARAREESSEPPYLATDTHWRPEAMQRVAEALTAFLARHVTLPSVQPPGYRVEPREARQIGDTTAMLDLPAGQTLYPPERVALRFVVGPNGDPWRPSRDADVLVLGDSFSNVYSLSTMGWGESAGFIEQLSYVLQRPVDRIVQNDQGAQATRVLLSRETGGSSDRLAGKRVVVWQFAARELAFGNWTVIPLPPAAPR